MKVGDLMTTEVVAVSSDESVAEAARAMRKNNTGAVVVVDGGEIKGILVDREVACECVGRGYDPGSTKVKEIMTENPKVGSPEMDLLNAAKIMGEGGFRRLPIVEGGIAVGLLSMSDLADYVKNINAWIFDELTKSTKKRIFKDRHP